MKRKTTTAPAKVYNYGCSYRGVVANADLVEEQYRLAHAYQQKLVELEMKRRTQIRTILAAQPDVALMLPVLTTLEADLTAAITAAKAVKQATRSRLVPPELKQRIARLKAELKVQRDAVKATKRASAANPEAQAALDAVLAEQHAAVKEARGTCGIYWGTYLILERAADQQRKEKHDPKHRPYTGEGRLAVQFQKGATVDQIFGDDTRMQLRSLGGKKRHMCKLRIGSNGRAPIWAEIEVFIHRPLPADSRITWAWLQRIRRGRTFIYSLQITLESNTFIGVPTGTKRVAVDLGWRVAEKGAGGLRVAYWRDSYDNNGELRLPPKLLSALEYPAQLLGVETNWFEKAQKELVAWQEGKTLPTEHTERTDHLSQWRSALRLAGYVWWWREHRFEGDTEIFAAMNEWRVRRFWHYRDWSLHQRDKAMACRKDLYRCFAAQLLTGCKELVLEDFDLRDFAVKRDDVPTAQRYWRMMGSPHELRLCLISAAKARGVTVTKVDPAMTTRRCNACGCETPWDQTQQMHTCSGCGVTWDQDDNASINLLKEKETAAQSP